MTSTYPQYAIATIPSSQCSSINKTNLFECFDDSIRILVSLGLAAKVTGDGLRLN